MSELVKDGIPYRAVYRTQNSREADAIFRMLKEYEVPALLLVEPLPRGKASEIFTRPEFTETAESLISQISRRAEEDTTT